MTRRSFLRNLGLACAALGVPVAAMARFDEQALEWAWAHLHSLPVDDDSFSSQRIMAYRRINALMDRAMMRSYPPPCA